MTRLLLGLGLVALAVLRDDFWFRETPVRVLGLPAELAYHVGLCVAASALMWAFVRFAWPDEDAE